MILITRPEEDARDYARELEDEGFSCLVAPMLSFKAVDFECPDLSFYDGILFTSAHAVRMLGEVSGRDITAYCVGKYTADASRQAGFSKVEAAAGTGKDLAALVTDLPDVGAQRFLHVHGQHVAFPLVETLREQGISADGLVVYEAEKAACIPDHIMAALSDKKIDVVTFFSKRTAEAFIDCVRAQKLDESLQYTKVLSISDAVLECVRFCDWEEMYVSETPDRNGMMMRLKQILQGFEHE